MDKIVHRKKRFIVLKQATATSLAVLQRAKFHTAASDSLFAGSCYPAYFAAA